MGLSPREWLGSHRVGPVDGSEQGGQGEVAEQEDGAPEEQFDEGSEGEETQGSEREKGGEQGGQVDPRRAP